jgi:hypothetical protein
MIPPLKTLLRCLTLAGLVWLYGLPVLAAQEGSIVLRRETGRLDADVRNLPLTNLLERLSAAGRWQVLVEPGLERNASAKFKDMPVSDGLRMLLGNLNFALIPQTNGVPQLFVFRSTMNSATQLIQPAIEELPLAGSSIAITNELIVRLKPGASIEELAHLLGAKVLGKIEGLNAYRLQFEDAAAAKAARESLASNPNVSGVDSNYALRTPSSPQQLLATSAGPLSLQLKTPTASGRVVVGLVDTAIQPLGSGLDAFIQPQISVAGPAELPTDGPTHATAMAETILTSVQNTTGGSSSVQILPVDVYGSSGTTTTFEVALGILKAVNAGANPINLSLGSEADSAFLYDVIKQAKAQGVVFFAAAGNKPTTAPTFPAAYPEVTAVTAADRQRQLASYANRGNFVDIIAPGTGVVYYNGRPFLVNGTSAAAAFASGMAAGVAEAKQKPIGAVEAAMRESLSVK